MHITNGSAAAASLKDALNLSSEQLLISCDVFSCGPLKPAGNLQDWQTQRLQYWQSVTEQCGEHTDGVFPRDLYTHYQELHQAERIDLWAGTALSDQSMLCFLADRLLQNNIQAPVYLHQFTTFDGCKGEVLGLGMLSPENIAAHQPEAMLLSSQHLADLQQAWHALLADTPEAYLALIQQEHPELPCLIRALRDLIYRYPSQRNGLSIWDELLLQHCTNTPRKAALVIGYTMAEAIERLDLTGDTYLYARLQMLAELEKPLVSLSKNRAPIRETQAAITPFGEAVLAGTSHLLDHHTIDDWVCGVHLTPNNLWQREAKTLKCITK